MSRRAKLSTYRLHKQSGQAVVTLAGGGVRHDVLLGPYDSPESRAEYLRVLGEWEVNHRRPPVRAGASRAAAASCTVNEVMLEYLRHAEGYYRQPTGEPTSEVKNIKLGLRRLMRLYGHTSAAAFDSVALEAVQADMIAAGLCRKRINKDMDRICRMFKWLASKKLVPLAVHQLLLTVEPVAAEEVAFEAGVVLLKKAKSEELRKKPAPAPDGAKPSGNSEPTDVTPTGTGPGIGAVGPSGGRSPVVVPPAGPTTKTLRLSGNIPAELWNRLGTRLLPKLRSGKDLKLGVDFSVVVEGANANDLVAELKQILADLGLQDSVDLKQI